MIGRTSIWKGKVEDNLFDIAFQDFLNLTRDVDEMEDRYLDKFPTGLTNLGPITAMPDSLLRGPWTDEMLKHFLWLARAGASIDGRSSTSGEVDHLSMTLVSC